MNERATHALYVSVSLWNTITLTPWNKINKTVSHETKDETSNDYHGLPLFHGMQPFLTPKKQKLRCFTSNITCQWHEHRTRKNSNTNWMSLTFYCNTNYETRLDFWRSASLMTRLFMFLTRPCEPVYHATKAYHHHQHIHSYTATYITKKNPFYDMWAEMRAYSFYSELCASCMRECMHRIWADVFYFMASWQWRWRANGKFDSIVLTCLSSFPSFHSITSCLRMSWKYLLSYTLTFTKFVILF